MDTRYRDFAATAKENVRRLAPEQLQRLGFLPKNGSYFPAVLYPPVPMYSPLGPEEFFTKSAATTSERFVVYAHIPFCEKRCRFCHFVSFEGASQQEKDVYLAALEKEMDLYLDRLSMTKIPAAAINIGGGTATCLSPEQLQRFLQFFTERIDLRSCEQFTYDVDVSTLLGDLGLERLTLLQRFGVDRITIGVQLFDDAILRDMNRANQGADVEEAVANARKAGIHNICADLIYGYPGQTVENWAEAMARVAGLGVRSFQLYRLRIKPHNLMPGRIARRHDQVPGDFPALQDVYVMQELGSLIAEAHGYSDDHGTGMFAKDASGVSEYIRKKFCQLYDVVGFGLSANNVLGGNIGIKASQFSEYYEQINRGVIPIARGKACSHDDLLRRAVTGPLRNQFRVDKSFFASCTGAQVKEVFRDKLDLLQRHDLMVEDAQSLQLTKRGHFFVDATCIQFYHPDYIPFPAAAYADAELNPYRQSLPLPLSV